MSLAQPAIISNPAAHLFAAALALSVAMAAGGVEAAEKAAVFEFEIIRSNVIPGVPEKRHAEEKRLAMIGGRLRDHLAKSGRFEIVDTAPVADRAAASNLRACGNCADALARDLGAAYAFTGTVQKVSELILNINVYVHDSANSKPLAVASVDLRGNTDESWRRGIDYLYKNILSKRLETLTK